VQEAEDNCATVDELQDILGRARAKKGMFEGDLTEGELEIGQISSLIGDIKPAAHIVADVWQEFVTTAKNPFQY
jgi:enoyl-[acyl-carrier protein] reductase II